MLSWFRAEAASVAARVESACDSCAGSCRPRFAARFKIPRAAFGESEYFGDTRFCRTADKEHATTTLGDSEITAVQDPPADDRPALPKARDDERHVGSSIGANEPWYVLEEPPRRARGFGDADDLPEEAAALAAEPGPLPGDGEVLAGEAAGEQINVLGRDGRFSPSARSAGLRSSHQPGPDSANIAGSLDAGPSGGEDALAEGVELDLPDDGASGALKAQVEPTHASEQ